MLLPGDSTFGTFLANAFAVFAFVLWLWLIIATASDVLCRKDISAAAKFLWVVLLVALPYVGVFAYILTESRGMAARRNAQANQARDELRDLMTPSMVDEIVKLDRLRAQNIVTEGEYLTMRSRLVT
jgi:hypothetical protein